MSDSTAEAVETLVFKNDSLIDALFTSRQQRRVMWATLTSESSTTLYSVSSQGKLEVAATIHWRNSLGAGSQLFPSKSDHSTVVEIQGAEFTTEQFGWGANRNTVKSNHFTLADQRCRWKPGSSGTHFDKTVYMNDAMTWLCKAEHASKTTDPSSKLSSVLTMLRNPTTSKSLLAAYCPSYNFSRQGGDLAIYPDGEPFTVSLLISLILMNSKEHEWQKIQSNMSPEELEANLTQKAASNRPP